MKPAARAGVAVSAMPSAPSLLRRKFTLLLAALAGAIGVYAQQPVARAYFYTEPNFGGEVFAIEAGSGLNNLELVLDSRGRPFNDRIASIELEGPVRVTIFQHAEYRGAALSFNRDMRDLSALPLEPGRRDSWDGTVSSVQLEGFAAGAPPVARWERREAERVVRADYLDCFGREPDQMGLRFYVSRLVDAGWSEPQFHDALRHSQEFRDRDLDAIIRRVFQEVLGRAPDASGIATYQKALSRGMTEGEMRADLLRSREGGEKRVHDAVTRAYREVLKREPDADGLASYSKLMLQKNWSESDVREGLRRSDEYRKSHAR